MQHHTNTRACSITQTPGMQHHTNTRHAASHKHPACSITQTPGMQHHTNTRHAASHNTRHAASHKHPACSITQTPGMQHHAIIFTFTLCSCVNIYISGLNLITVLVMERLLCVFWGKGRGEHPIGTGIKI